MDLTGINRRPQDLYDLSEQMLGASQQESFPYEFELAGVRFVAHAGVFVPKHMPGADTFARWLPFTPGMEFLEIGTGTGVIAVFAALAGARVVATDVNPAAIENARANVAKHGLGDRIDVRHGDVFDPIRPDERFDLIFWNVPFAWMEPELQPTDLQKSTFDPGYRATRRYVTEGPRYLKPGGRLTLGFSTVIGRFDLVEEFAAEAGLEAKVVEHAAPTELFPAPLELVELSAAP